MRHNLITFLPPLDRAVPHLHCNNWRGSLRDVKCDLAAIWGFNVVKHDASVCVPG
jgi:hypothetical protein